MDFLKKPVVQESTCRSIVNNVNNLVKQQVEGRLFAVIHLCGKQYKVTAGDVVVIEGYWPPTVGDEIRLEKVSITLQNIRVKYLPAIWTVLGFACWWWQFYIDWPTFVAAKSCRRASNCSWKNHCPYSYYVQKEAKKAIYANQISSISSVYDTYKLYQYTTWNRHEFISSETIKRIIVITKNLNKSFYFVEVISFYFGL